MMTADKERKRAISREAARKRRRVEADVFADLLRLLPLQPSVRSHLDKPSIIRLTLSYIRLHALMRGSHTSNTTGAFAAPTSKETMSMIHQQGLTLGDSPSLLLGRHTKSADPSDVLTSEIGLYLRVMEGFLMILSAHGDIIFLSDNVSSYAGLTQTELMGHNVFEYTHPCDHEELRHTLRLTTGGVWSGQKLDFVMRIKSTLTHKGRSAHLKSATWKVLHCQGRVKVCPASSSSCLLLTCRPLPLSHTLLSAHTFTSHHTMDMRFTYCDQRVTALLGYKPEELLGRSIYELCHTLDTTCLNKNHLNLCLKSQSFSGQHRLMVKAGGYVWAESHSAVVPSSRTPRSRAAAQRPLCVLSVTYVLSGVEEPSLQLSLDQTLDKHLQ